MADFERTVTVMASADAAFAFLADPANLAEYVPPVTHLDTLAVEGGPEGDAEAEAAGEGPVHVATFLPDTAAGRVTWGQEGSDYHGSATVTPGTSSTSQVTIALHLRDDADAAAVDTMLDQAVRNLQRLLILRR